VSAYAYWTTEVPPNVVVYLTQDSSQYFDPKYERRDRQILKMWAKKAHHLAQPARRAQATNIVRLREVFNPSFLYKPPMTLCTVALFPSTQRA